MSDSGGDGFEVELRVYDLSRGMARQMSQAFLGKQIDGIWHTGVHVYGYEYFYGGGLQMVPPAEVESSYGMKPERVIKLGRTSVSREAFHDFLRGVSARFTASTYDLFTNNCNNFSDTASNFLLGKGIPEYIINLPNEALSSPMGGMLRSVVERMQTNINGHFTGDPFGAAASSSAVPGTSAAPAPVAAADPAAALSAALSSVTEAVERDGVDGAREALGVPAPPGHGKEALLARDRTSLATAASHMSSVQQQAARAGKWTLPEPSLRAIESTVAACTRGSGLTVAGVQETARALCSALSQWGGDRAATPLLCIARGVLAELACPTDAHADVAASAEAHASMRPVAEKVVEVLMRATADDWALRGMAYGALANALACRVSRGEGGSLAASVEAAAEEKGLKRLAAKDMGSAPEVWRGLVVAFATNAELSAA